MPLTRVEIEQIGPGKWVAEVEGGGGPSAVRRNVVGASFDQIILAVVEAHAAVVPAPKPVTPPAPMPLTASERAAVESVALQREVDALPALNALREQAEALGIDVDGRWGETRLRVEIEAAKARQAAGSAA